MKRKIVKLDKTQLLKGVKGNGKSSIQLFGTILIPGTEENLTLKLLRRDFISPLSIGNKNSKSNRIKIKDHWINTRFFKKSDSYFLAVYICQQHGLNIIKTSSQSWITLQRANQILLYLSFFLQTGESILTGKNFPKIVYSLPSKFLPFTIDYYFYRYWFFLPTEDNIIKGIEKFEKIMDILSEIDLVRLFLVTEMNEKIFCTKDLYDLTNHVRQDLQMELKDKFGYLQSKLSFVYQDLKGPQDTINWDELI